MFHYCIIMFLQFLLTSVVLCGYYCHPVWYCWYAGLRDIEKCS